MVQSSRWAEFIDVVWSGMGSALGEGYLSGVQFVFRPSPLLWRAVGRE